MICCEINNLTKSRIDKGFLKKVVSKTCRVLPRACRGEISIVLVGDAKIKELNKKYRNKNQVTDVLAFDYGLPGGQGEIFICLPRAKRQARQLGHSLKQELAILLIHGILHLAGYHDNKIKQEEMWQKII